MSVPAIREHMAALGHDLSHLTDDEIAAGVQRTARLLASTGITAEEAGANLVAVINDRSSSGEQPGSPHDSATSGGEPGT
jgi:hypothetical protein